MAQDLTDDIASMFDTGELGDDAVYTPPGGAAVPCQVHLRRAQVEATGGELAAIVQDLAAIFQYAQVPAPVRDATLVVGSTTYLVDEEILNNGRIVKVRLRRP